MDWDAGPRSVAELESTYSQNLRLDTYGRALDLLRPHVFACRCSRADVSAASEDGGYPGTCRDAGIPLDTPDVAWRFRLDSPAQERDPVACNPIVRDPVVRKKDGRPAYHIASVVDDVDMGITHVVRGEDLHASTRIQQALAPLERITFIHHPLLTAPPDDTSVGPFNPGGQKLSKSAGAQAQSLLQTPGIAPESVRAGFEAWLGTWLGTSAPDGLSSVRNQIVDHTGIGEG